MRSARGIDVLCASWSAAARRGRERGFASGSAAVLSSSQMLHLGFAVRLLYFLIAPFVVLSTGRVIPMTGVLINICLLVGGFIAVELLRDATGRHPLVARLLARQLRYAEYYRVYPPRSFIYYMFYLPLLPYVLVNRRARGEFGLYRGYTILGIVLVVVFGIVDYFVLWWPEIRVGPFLSAMIATLVLQVAVMVALLIPLAVTIVGFQLANRRRAVWVMLGAAGLSVLLHLLGKSVEVGEMIPVEVAARVRLRGEAAPERAQEAQDAALRGIWDELRAGTADVDGDGWIVGDTLGRAQATLMRFYRADEAAVFAAQTWPVGQPGFVMLQCYQHDHPPNWRAMAGDSQVLTDASRVPPEIYNVSPVRKRDR